MRARSRPTVQELERQITILSHLKDDINYAVSMSSPKFPATISTLGEVLNTLEDRLNTLRQKAREEYRRLGPNEQTFQALTRDLERRIRTR